MKKCYFCGEQIEKESELVEKKIPLVCKNGKKRMYRRTFHLSCVSKYAGTMDDSEDRVKENTDWDKVYQYYKKLLGVPRLSPYTTQRLLGLYNGTFAPNGTNVRGRKSGYTYEEIYRTLIFSSPSINIALKNISFKDDQHRTNYIMKILFNNINEVVLRMQERSKSEKLIAKVDVKKELETGGNVASYKSKGGKSSETSRLAQLIEDNALDEEFENLFL